ncbi:MAG TPA: hypothetical protein VFU93_08970 [Acidimicrobiales bacterium]|nr:hypothetical protein [Acidimicrobiales bacterium]
MRRWAALIVVVLAAACTDEPEALFDEADPGPCIGTPHEVPDGGWLSDDGEMAPLEGHGIRGTDGLTTLLDALPPGFEVTRAEELATTASCTIQRVVEAADRNGGSLFIEQRQLEDTGSLFNVPLSGRQSQDQYGSRGELVTDDFNGDGNRLTALLITDTGGWTLVVARGANGPNLSGWPTTMPPTSAPGEPVPAPLTLDEVVELAETISAATSTRPSR